MSAIDFLKDSEDRSSKDAKYNLFRFQDYLVDQLKMYAAYFQQANYPLAFDVLQQIYMDTNGFFTEEELQELREVHDMTKRTYHDFNNYEFKYRIDTQRNTIRKPIYIPPTELYESLLKFKMLMMRCLTKHQLLIPIKRRDMVGVMDE